jgi:hypothetical protein
MEADGHRDGTVTRSRIADARAFVALGSSADELPKIVQRLSLYSAPKAGEYAFESSLKLAAPTLRLPIQRSRNRLEISPVEIIREQSHSALSHNSSFVRKIDVDL